MTKASRNNRGSTPEKRIGDWRTPPKLFKAIGTFFSVQFIIDAAATEKNTLCPYFITKEMDTLSMSCDDIEAHMQKACRSMRENQALDATRRPAIFCNPDYNDSTDLLRWMRLAGTTSFRHRIPWIFLIPSSRSEQDWWHEAMAWHPQVSYPKGRVAFNLPNGKPGPSPNHPSAIIALNAPLARPQQITSFPEWRK
jgi:phage N-6-adenine-methyltransferase